MYSTIKSWFLMFLIILIINSGVLGQDEVQYIRPTVTTPLGEVEGYIGITVNQTPFIRFEGVPYAKPPVGNLRYEDPQDPEPWFGTWKANVQTKCMQHDHFTLDHDLKYVVVGDEDCLYVNIYTHSLQEDANLPVLVHIHGGAFIFGRGADYGPEIIMDRQIVYVNFNYRLGTLGFLSTEDEVLPGNLGLKDQTKALKWIKENIQYFGGNPNSITIQGLSAGGASVHLHYLMPPSQGLFKNGISQSGCAINSWVLVENAREKTEQVADLVGCPTHNSSVIVECLKKKPARHIVQSTAAFQKYLYNPFSPFGVVIDGKWAKNPVLPDHPYNLLKAGKVYDVPWIISYTSAEGLYPAAEFYSDEKHIANINDRWNELIPFILHYNESAGAFRDMVSEKIRQHYFGTLPLTKETYSILVELMGDRLFVADIEKAARLHSVAVKSDVYSYFYNYRANTSFSEITSKSTDNLGVTHGDDVLLILNVKPMNPLRTETDRKMSQVLIDIFLTFMENGSPTNILEWLPLSKRPQHLYRVLRINGPDDFKLLGEKNIGQRKFWESLPLKENEQLLEEEKEEEAKDEL